MIRLLIFSPHFAPAFRGGGPIQSLVNMVRILRDDIEIFVFCSARDLGDTMPLLGIKVNEWNDFSGTTKVFYAGPNFLASLKAAFQFVNPDRVYINGMFSIHFNIIPLALSKIQRRSVVLSPRGMLQVGALSIKPIKKKLFLLLFKLLGFHKNIHWHATDDQEKGDIRKIFGPKSIISIASNIPKHPLKLLIERSKISGQLRMIYLSLIAEKKNLQLVLEALTAIPTPIQFHIYGPIKDELYWKSCQSLIQNQKHEISYLGSVNPTEVQDKFSGYDVMILPTKGENFGHAIYEALSVGTPAIISSFTPWGRLQECQAGITVDLDVASLRSAIEIFVKCDELEFSRLSSGALRLAKSYYYSIDFKKEYESLFS